MTGTPWPRLFRNAVWNLAGQALPMVSGIVAVPVLVRGISLERFGVMTIVWAFVGYFSVFDLGVGRAVTRWVAERLGTDAEDEIVAGVWTGVAVMVAVGAAMALAGVGVSSWLVRSVLNIPPRLQPETVLTFQLLSLAIPVVIVSIALRGIMEAQQRFRGITLVRVVSGLTTFLSPVAMLPFTHDLAWIVGVLVAWRVAFLLVYLAMALRSLPALWRLTFDLAAVGPLLGYGAWITVANVVAPLLQYLDRFLIAGLISIGAVAYYTTPSDLATKLLVMPLAATGVLFPAFASMPRRREQATALLLRSEVILFAALFPAVLVGIAFAPEAMRLWLGASFAEHSYRLLQVILLGVLVNALSPALYVMLQAAGRPDLTGKLALAEVPLYAAGLWKLVGVFGTIGASMAWTLRVSVELVVLIVLLRRVGDLPLRRGLALGAALGASLVVLAVPMLVPRVELRLLYASVVLALVALGAAGLYARHAGHLGPIIGWEQRVGSEQIVEAVRSGDGL